MTRDQTRRLIETEFVPARSAACSPSRHGEITGDFDVTIPGPPLDNAKTLIAHVLPEGTPPP